MNAPAENLARPLPLAALSTVVLALEVFQTRLVSYSVHVLLLYAVIGIAMLGFGAAGSLVAVRSGWLDPGRAPRVLAWAALAFSAGVVIAHAAFVRLTPFLQAVDFVTLLVAALLALPYVAAGTVVTIALSTAGPRLGRVYAANLLGSGVGCFLPLWLLGPLDGEAFLGLMALLAFGCAVAYVRLSGAPMRSALGLATLATLALCVVALTAGKRVFPIQPEPLPSGQVSQLYYFASRQGFPLEKRYDRWNPTGRIEIFAARDVPGEPGPYHAMFYAQDASAGSSLVRWNRHAPAPRDEPVARMCSETLYGLGHFRARPRTLVIGLGGGPDLQCAIYNGSRHVDVVEINPDSIAAVRGPFDEWLGGVGTDPAVRFHRRDGRGFAHAMRGAGYDLIQLSGVDTKQNYASGALALAENRLYTLEAFSDYFAALSRRGVVTILRFGEIEAIRLAHTAVRALRARGAANPETHVAILGSGPVFGVLVGREPLREEDGAHILARVRTPDFRGFNIFFYNDQGIPFDRRPAVHYLPGRYATGNIARFFEEVAHGRESEFAREGALDVSPTSDDRPFFFDIHRYDHAASWRLPHVIALRNVIGSVIVLSLLLILLPVRRLGAGAAAFARLRSGAFFGSVGLAFVLIEVWMLHRFAMFLGHQTYSLSIVLAALLVSTGLGAWASGRVRMAPGRRALVGALGAVAWLVIGLAWLPGAMELAWRAELGVRGLLAAGFVFPCGLAMGLPFVAGLDWVRATHRAIVPWCVGVNSFASVLASVGVIPLVMALGYVSSLVAGAALYVLAAALAVGMRGAPADA